ncbi:alpha/beta fold hydrolase [Oleiharenicola sp. Vm1]|uniref:alpha/beta fold hydrolase n=1 Tax=Oleiharenicola sp. Vm1 TaxID=3398393 RepID=UPI0039F62224
MHASRFLPPFPALARLSQQTAAPFQALLRTTGYKLRPPRALEHPPRVTARQAPLLASGLVGPQARAQVRVEERGGALPAIVVGGFVPDATEAFYLLRGGLLRHGSVFYFNYPRRGFSTDLFLAQLEDLIAEIATLRGQRPALIAVSFGAGLVLELLRRAAARGETLPLAGLTLVSPVACTADLIDVRAPKPTTLLGRVLLPYLRGGGAPTARSWRSPAASSCGCSNRARRTSRRCAFFSPGPRPAACAPPSSAASTPSTPPARSSACAR